MNLFNAKNTRCRSFALQIVALLFLTIGSRAALASGSCSGGGQTYTLSFPSSISVPRDVPNGTLLGSWVNSPAPTNIWSCTTNADDNGARGLIGSFSTASGQTYTSGGVVYTLYNTNVQGVGIAVAENIYTNNGWNGWKNVTSTWAGQIFRPITATWSNGAQIAVALVKTGPVVAGVIPSTVVAYTAGVGGTTQTGTSVSYVMSPVTVIVLACTTPDVVVPLGNHSRSELTGLNTYTASTSFNVSLNGCPAGMNSVKYRIDPVTSVANSTQSVVTLDASSSATGVGVQLLDGNGSVFKLSTDTIFSSYNTSTGGSYTIPFKARYYQTGATVSAGKANTSMTFTMTYQ